MYIYRLQIKWGYKQKKFFCGSLPWEPPAGYPNRYRSNNSNRITVITNNPNDTGIVLSGVYTWVPLKASTEL
jgi:hypothetical protein